MINMSNYRKNLMKQKKTMGCICLHKKRVTHVADVNIDRQAHVRNEHASPLNNSIYKNTENDNILYSFAGRNSEICNL